MDIKYTVEIQTGGSIKEVFSTSKDAETYYNNNIKLNPVMYKLEPFKYNNELYYYCLGSNVISLYNSNYNYLTKLKINPNEYDLAGIIKGLENYLNEEPIF